MMRGLKSVSRLMVDFFRDGLLGESVSFKEHMISISSDEGTLLGATKRGERSTSLKTFNGAVFVVEFGLTEGAAMDRR